MDIKREQNDKGDLNQMIKDYWQRARTNDWHKRGDWCFVTKEFPTPELAQEFCTQENKKKMVAKRLREYAE